MLMKKFSYFLIASVALMFAACTTPDTNEGGNEGGTPTTELAANTFSINDVVGEFKSVALAQMEEYIYLAASPSANIASAEDILGADEFVYLLVGPQLVGKEFDLMTEQNTYTIMSTLAGAVLEGVAPEATDEISAGKASFSLVNNVATAKVEISLANGTVLKLHLSAEQKVVVNENTIARGDEEKPLRAAFYMEEDGYTSLYFTPGNIDYFEEIYDATWFTYITVPTSLTNGQNQTLSEASLLMFGMVDNLNYDNYVDIYGDDLQGATGDYTITKRGEGVYTANINITVNGVLYKVSFDGTCVSAFAEPEKKTNYLSYNGVEYEISAATLTEANSLYTFTFTNSSGKELVLTAPDIAFGGDAYGFSQSKDFTVSYDGKLFSKANGNNGTMTAYYKVRSQELELEFTNYDQLNFNYTGAVIVK